MPPSWCWRSTTPPRGANDPMVEKAEIIAAAPDEGMRLDLCVMSHFPSSSRALTREAISRGQVLLNGKAAEKGAKIGRGDKIEVLSLLEVDDVGVMPDPDVAVDVVFDDGMLLGADKPCGMAVQPLSPFEKGTLANGLVAIRPEFAANKHEPLSAGAVHRIDAGTSGLVIFAANHFVFAAMRSLFALHDVRKTYLALVEGDVRREGLVSCELAHAPRLAYCKMVEYAVLNAADKARTRPLPAETRYRPIRARGGRTLLEVEIRTGVTHQIRAQLALAGHPIAGDALYGGKDAGGLAPHGGFCLHSLRAEFKHPSTGAETRIETPPPPWAAVSPP